MLGGVHLTFESSEEGEGGDGGTRSGGGSCGSGGSGGEAVQWRGVVRVTSKCLDAAKAAAFLRVLRQLMQTGGVL